jgi:hypothetical protein
MNNTEAFKKLNFTVNLQELESFYLDTKNNYEHLRWTWEKNKIHLNDDALSSCQDINEIMMTGWMLESDMLDRSIPPSMLRSKHARTAWYDTEIMSGVAKRLKDKVPFAYRWTLFVLPPGGKVVKHTDAGEYAIHIPLYWDENALFIFGDHPNTTQVYFPADGSAYLVDAEVPHETVNNSTTDRVGLVCRIKRDKLNEILNITGIV